jgi:adenine phosphoribosyltransferase
MFRIAPPSPCRIRSPSIADTLMMSTRAHEPLVVRLARTLRVVPDFPSPGIQFQDVTPVLADAELLAETVRAMSEPWRNDGVTHVAGIESRGFIFAAPIAVALGAGLIPIRKPGKLPWKSAGQDYALEYGSGRLEIHVDACPAPARVLLVDDVLATGGTANAACGLIESVGGTVVGCAFFLAIAALGGERQLQGRRLETLLER